MKPSRYWLGSVLLALCLPAWAVKPAKAPAFNPASKAVQLQLRQDEGDTTLLLCPDASGRIQQGQQLADGKLQVSGKLLMLAGHTQALLQLDVQWHSDDLGEQVAQANLLLERFAQPLGALRVVAPALQITPTPPRPQKSASSKQAASQVVASAPAAEKITVQQHGLAVLYVQEVDRPAICPLPEGAINTGQPARNGK
ncbi:MAG: hypothetical protein JO338_00115 [Aquitalea sp.]|nr:hypothetical protein [Aquitalea sp.]